ncbi:hypothetical protein EYC59_00630 [Candidatus Saccharibacteria bacterium]|nr:MAG: hypothetical protein EYC59_00630 [Candidatus Saccharibacteria bacterium]
MRSSIYIQETGPDTVQVDTTASPAQLTNPDTWYGFTFTKTAQHLGLDIHDVPEPVSSGCWEVRGSTAKAQENIPNLQRHIGLIARYGAERRQGGRWARDYIGRILGELVQHRLPGLPEDATLMRTVGVLLNPLADATNDDGCALYYARTPHWVNRNEPARNADGSPIAPFHMRDIGGMPIDDSGRPSPERVAVNTRISDEAWRDLARLGWTRETNPAEQVRAALRGFLDDPAAPNPKHVDRTDAHTYRGTVVSFPRETLRELFYERGYTGDITFSDLVAAAVERHLAEAMADPETADALETARREQEERQASFARILHNADEPS